MRGFGAFHPRYLFTHELRGNRLQIAALQKNSLLVGIERRRRTIVTSPDWTGTTLAGRGGILTPGSTGIPREHAKTSSFGVDAAGTMRLSSAPEPDGAQYHRVHSRVCNL